MLSKEQTEFLEQAIILLFKLRNDQSVENWEVKREREFNKLYGVQEKFSEKSLIQEIKEMLLKLNIEGSVRERANGLLEFRNSTFGSVYGRSKEEFEQKFLEKLKQLKTGNKSKSSVLFSEFFNETYLPYKRENIKESSIKDLMYDYNYIINNNFDKPLNRYTSESVEKFLLAIPKTHKRKTVRGVFNNVFTYAKQLGKIKVNPCDNVTSVKHKSTKGRAMSFADQLIFFDNIFACKKIKLVQKLYLLYVFLTGSRRAEALDVALNDFDIQNNVLHIPGTKSGGSDRDIPLFPLVKKLYVCTQQIRGVDSKTFFGLKLSQVDKLMKFGINGYRLHDLRHTFGTIEICVQKLDPKTVSLHMGHADITMTLNTYTHPEQLDKALFFDGSKSDEEKLAVLREKYQVIINKISAYIDEHTQNVPKE